MWRGAQPYGLDVSSCLPGSPGQHVGGGSIWAGSLGREVQGEVVGLQGTAWAKGPQREGVHGWSGTSWGGQSRSLVRVWCEGR